MVLPPGVDPEIVARRVTRRWGGAGGEHQCAGEQMEMERSKRYERAQRGAGDAEDGRKRPPR
jgi:hypothetical protein